jgi:hypothetical protein
MNYDMTVQYNNRMTMAARAPDIHNEDPKAQRSNRKANQTQWPTPLFVPSRLCRWKSQRSGAASMFVPTMVLRCSIIHTKACSQRRRVRPFKPQNFLKTPHLYGFASSWFCRPDRIQPNRSNPYDPAAPQPKTLSAKFLSRYSACFGAPSKSGASCWLKGINHGKRSRAM